MACKTDNMNTKFTQINLNHSKLAQEHIANRINLYNKNSDPFCICVQEPYVYGGKAAKQPLSCNKYNFIKHPRTAIYTSKQ